MKIIIALLFFSFVNNAIFAQQKLSIAGRYKLISYQHDTSHKLTIQNKDSMAAIYAMIEINSSRDTLNYIDSDDSLRWVNSKKEDMEALFSETYVLNKDFSYHFEKLSAFDSAINSSNGGFYNLNGKTNKGQLQYKTSSKLIKLRKGKVKTTGSKTITVDFFYDPKLKTITTLNGNLEEDYPSYIIKRVYKKIT